MARFGPLPSFLHKMVRGDAKAIGWPTPRMSPSGLLVLRSPHAHDNGAIESAPRVVSFQASGSGITSVAGLARVFGIDPSGRV